MTTHYFTWADQDGKHFDAECITYLEAYRHACQVWDEKKSLEGLVGIIKISVIKFHYGDEGEKIVDQSTELWV